MLSFTTSNEIDLTFQRSRSKRCSNPRLAAGRCGLYNEGAMTLFGRFSQGVAVLLAEHILMFRKVVVPPSSGSKYCAVR